jgi:tyrosyl-tRNA synthetase
MSKRYDNYISFNHSSKDMFGRIMSIPDEVMWTYFKLLLEYSDGEIEGLKGRHPMDAKKFLAQSLVGRFYGPEVGDQELADFEAVFSHGEIPETMPEFSLQAMAKDPVTLADAMAYSQLFESNREIRRLIEQGAIKVNGKCERDFRFPLQSAHCPHIIQSGKRVFLKVIS